MSNIDKQALREEFRNMQDHYSDPADRERQEIYIAAEALLDELEHYKSREERVTKLVLDNSTSWDALYKKLEASEKRIAELVNDEVRQRLANAEHQLHMAELAKCNLRASRKAQFRKRKAAERRIAELEARTVTLPPKEHDNGTDSQIDINAGFANRMWQKCYDAIRAAGIKVKGE